LEISVSYTSRLSLSSFTFVARSVGSACVHHAVREWLGIDLDEITCMGDIV